MTRPEEISITLTPSPDNFHKESANIVQKVLKSKETIEYLLALIESNINHNYHNSDQNQHAQFWGNFEKIVQKDGIDKAVISIAQYANRLKKNDAIISFVSESLKVILLLSYDYHFQDKQEEDYKLFQRVSYGAVPLQMFLTFLSSINGYNASVAGHFSAEAKNSFQQIIDFFSNLKFDEQGNLTKENIAVDESKNHHVHSVGGKARHIGTVTNISGSSLNFYVLSQRLSRRLNSFVSNIGYIASSLVVFGKLSSLLASKQRRQDVAIKLENFEETISQQIVRLKNESKITDQEMLAKITAKIIEETTTLKQKNIDTLQQEMQKRGAILTSKIYINSWQKIWGLPSLLIQKYASPNSQKIIQNPTLEDSQFSKRDSSKEAINLLVQQNSKQEANSTVIHPKSLKELDSNIQQKSNNK